jgi:hypothetical protein
MPHLPSRSGLARWASTSPPAEAAIEHKVAGNWHVLWSGDEGYPQNVPRRIAKDLLAGIPDL